MACNCLESLRDLQFNNIMLAIADKEGIAQAIARNKEYYNTTASVAGLMAGFVFLVTNSNIEWSKDSILSDSTRDDFYATFLILSLLSALASLILSIELLGATNTIGASEYYRTWLEKNQMILAWPEAFLILSRIRSNRG